ncbi:hypothetical protein yaldo0001_21240 [Yersinia aldovae ATCC 35236]|nr:hypothetical protein yaldo0001_21240 [Yersinia aldovae ATCC 35236]
MQPIFACSNTACRAGEKLLFINIGNSSLQQKYRLRRILLYYYFIKPATSKNICLTLHR